MTNCDFGYMSFVCPSYFYSIDMQFEYTSKQLYIGITQKNLSNFLTTNHLPNLLVITQEYETNAEREYVIIGNTALMKCEIPSFVADFVSVESWKDNKNNEYFTGISNNYGKFVPLYDV